MRIVTPALVFAALAPASAGAAPFDEPPLEPVTGAATCLRATGAPGELVRWTSTGASFLQAGAGGVTPGAEVGAGRPLTDCPVVASQPNGAGLLAFVCQDAGAKPIVRVSLRAPGGTWSAPTTLAGAHPYAPPALAVSERGEAVLAWAEPVGAFQKQTYRVRVARRPAGGTFGVPQTLATQKLTSPPDPLAGIAANGEAIVAWAALGESGTFPLEPIGSAEAAIAPPGGTFSAPSRISGVSDAALAVAPDGRALLALTGAGKVRVAERASGQAFGAPVDVADAPDLLGAAAAVALRADGGAVVAWQGVAAQSLSAVTRTGPGAFGSPVVLAHPIPAGGDPFTTALIRIFAVAFSGLGFDASLTDINGGMPRAAVTSDGRALITWDGLRRRAGITSWLAPRMAALPLAGGHVDVQALGGPLRNAGSITPLLLADGAPAVAWTDNSPGFGTAQGRLRLALEGVTTAPDPPAPALTVGSPRKTVLTVDDSLVLPIRCGGPCEVRATVAGPFGAGGLTELAHGGAGRLELPPSLGSPIAPLRRGPVHVTVAYGAPGARHPATKLLTLTLRRPPGPPVPHVLDLRARKRGNAIDVTWRTDIAAKPDDFLVTGTATGSAADAPLALATDDDEHSSHRFHFTLRPSKGVRYVAVAVATETLRIVRRATTQVR